MTPDQITNLKNDLKKAQKATLLLDTQSVHDKEVDYDRLNVLKLESQVLQALGW